MSRLFLHAALWTLLLTIPAAAQQTDLPQADVSIAPPTATLTPEAAVVSQYPATHEACGCQSEALGTPCATCGPHLRTRDHGYYRAMRQSMSDNRCCGDCFGGFGGLWATYCADKQRCCGAACQETTCCPPPASCAACKVRLRLPSLHLRGRRAGCGCDHCAAQVGTCDCTDRRQPQRLKAS